MVPLQEYVCGKKMERGSSLKIEALEMEKLEVKSDSMDERGFHLEEGC